MKKIHFNGWAIPGYFYRIDNDIVEVAFSKTSMKKLEAWLGRDNNSRVNAPAIEFATFQKWSIVSDAKLPFRAVYTYRVNETGLPTCD